MYNDEHRQQISNRPPQQQQQQQCMQQNKNKCRLGTKWNCAGKWSEWGGKERYASRYNESETIIQKN